jgi:hypothetical protein
MDGLVDSPDSGNVPLTVNLALIRQHVEKQTVKKLKRRS